MIGRWKDDVGLYASVMSEGKGIGWSDVDMKFDFGFAAYGAAIVSLADTASVVGCGCVLCGAPAVDGRSKFDVVVDRRVVFASSLIVTDFRPVVIPVSGLGSSGIETFRADFVGKGKFFGRGPPFGTTYLEGLG